jgi:ribosomal protein S18 acetylase RimI-like enzyme
MLGEQSNRRALDARLSANGCAARTFVQPAVIRPAGPADVPAIARIHADAWRTSYTKVLPSTVREDLSLAEREAYWRDFVGARDIRRVFVSLNDGNDVVGFASCGPNRTADPRYPGELYAIYLLARYRGSGRGRALFDAVRTYLQGQELTPFQLWVLAGNENVDRLYEKLGGRRVASHPTVVDGADVYEHAYAFAL